MLCRLGYLHFVGTYCPFFFKRPLPSWIWRQYDLSHINDNYENKFHLCILKMVTPWDIVLFALTEVDWHFRGTCFHHHYYPGNGDSQHLRNIVQLLRDHMAQYPRIRNLKIAFALVLLKVKDSHARSVTRMWLDRNQNQKCNSFIFWNSWMKVSWSFMGYKELEWSVTYVIHTVQDGAVSINIFPVKTSCGQLSFLWVGLIFLWFPHAQM